MNTNGPATSRTRRFQYGLGALFGLMLAAAIVAWWAQLEFQAQMVLLAVFLGAVVMPAAAIGFALLYGKATSGVAQQINEFTEVQRALPPKIRDGNFAGRRVDINAPWSWINFFMLWLFVIGAFSRSAYVTPIYLGVLLLGCAVDWRLSFNVWRHQQPVLLQIDPPRRISNWQLGVLSLAIALMLVGLFLHVSLLLLAIVICSAVGAYMLRTTANCFTEQGIVAHKQFLNWDQIRSFYWTAENNFVILPLRDAQDAQVYAYMKIPPLLRDTADELLRNRLPEAGFDLLPGSQEHSLAAEARRLGSAIFRRRPLATLDQPSTKRE